MSALQIINPKTNPEHVRGREIAKEIQQQILTARIVTWSWGSHAWRIILPVNGFKVSGPTLQFKVQGHHFKGHVRVELDEGTDTYNVHFGRYGRQYKDFWLNLETRTDVYCDQLVKVIDDKVEYIKIYGVK